MSRMETTHDAKKRLPDGWHWVRLGEVIGEDQAGFACGLRDPQGIAQLRMNNLDTRGNFVWDDVLRVPHEANDIEQFLIVPGDVLFNNTNSTELVGKSALFEGYVEPIVYSNHFTRLRTVAEALLPNFLASWLNHQWQQGVFAAICNRWIGQSAVKADKLLNLDFPLPPLGEQRRIAMLLKDQMAAVEKARAAAQARLEAVKTLPASLLRQVFPQPGQPLPDGWRWVKLREVCQDISDGTHFTPTYVFEGVPFLSVKDVREERLSFIDCRYITKEQHHNFCRRCKPEKGDVLYTKVGTTGIAKAIDIDVEFSIFVSVALLKLQSTIVPNYLEKVLNAPVCRTQAENLTQGMANRNLVLKDLKLIMLPLPPLDEQQRIAAVLCKQMAAVEKARAAAEEEVATISALPAALLRRAFNGEL